MRTLRSLVVVVVLLVLGTAACGDGGSADSTSGETAISEDAGAGAEAGIELSDEDASGEVGGAVEGSGPPGPDGGIFGDGTWGHVELEGAKYGAISRSCQQSAYEEGGASDAITFDLVDGQTKNSLELRLFTQNGTEYGAEFYDLDGSLMLSGAAEVRDVHSDITFAEGKLDSGGPFSFELLIAGACE